MSHHQDASNTSASASASAGAPPLSPTFSSSSSIGPAAAQSGSVGLTSLALRDNDNTVARGAPEEGDEDQAQAQPKQQQQQQQASVPAIAVSDTEGHTSIKQSSDADADTEAGAAKNAGWWGNFKQYLYSKTKGGRISAQEAELQAELKRQREMDPTPFPFRAYELGQLLDPKNVPAITQMGGVEALLRGLGIDPNAGLDLAADTVVEDAEKTQQQHDDVEAAAAVTRHKDFVQASREDRERVFGTNHLPERKAKSLLLLMWLAFQDKILILLSVAAVVSLALGLYSDFGREREEVPCLNPPPGHTGCLAPQVEWVEGVAIIVAIVIVDLVGSLNDWQKERQFQKLNAKKEQRDVKLIRQGKPALVNVHDVLVGDILQLEPGEIIPCDGIFLSGHNVKCDESGATGESDLIRKIPYEECVKGGKGDCFLLSGAKVTEGVGSYVVVAIGTNSFNGKLMLSLRSDAESTPLQGKLNRLAELIAKLGAAAGLLLFIALFIRFLVAITRGSARDYTSDAKAEIFVDVLILAVTVVVVAVPEGLPLAVTLALAFATKRMTKMNLLVRVLGACETMANANVVCTDKTGTLTQNEMTVVAGSVGAHLKFALNLSENQDRVQVNNDGEAEPRASSVERREGRRDWSIDQQELSTVIDGPLRTLFNDAIAVNSTAFEEEASKDKSGKAPSIAEVVKKQGVFAALGRLVSRKKKDDDDEVVKAVGFVGSKTETALLKMAKELGWEHYRSARERNEIVQMIPFSSERKAMGVVVKLREGGYRLYAKGASEVLSKLCTKHVEVPHVGVPTDTVTVTEFTEETRDNIAKTIIFYANQTLRTIAITYRDFEQWPPAGAEFTDSSSSDSDTREVDYNWMAQGMTLLAITGIEDPLRPGVKDAVAACARAGVQVKMCTGDNVLTARSTATQCGIFTPGGIVMEGPVFRNLSDADMLQVVPRLQVLARSSPEDKKILVSRLKAMGNVVGVTGDGTNDGPALKTANVGFSMGIAGTEVAKEASDIILMDDNFASIVSAIMWGRCVNDSVRKFLSFQLVVNVSAVIITFVTAVASEEEESSLTAVQLLYINLLMDSWGALALATDPAHPGLLNRLPDKLSSPLITVDMWKMIIGQSLYQVIVVFVLHFAGPRIFGFSSDDVILRNQQETELGALVFNAFAWMTLFSQVNARRLDRGLNIFEGVFRNPWFLSIMALEIGIQVLIIFVGGAAFSVTPLGGRDWAISIIAGVGSLLIGVLVRLLPTKPVEDFMVRWRMLSDPDELPTTQKSSHEDYVEKAKGYETTAIGEVAERLGAYNRIRGGRIRSSSFVFKSQARRMRDADVHPQSLMALVPALVGASVGSGWKPTQPAEASIKDPAAGDPSVSSSELYQGGKLQFHKDTTNDPFLDRLKAGHHA